MTQVVALSQRVLWLNRAFRGRRARALAGDLLIVCVVYSALFTIRHSLTGQSWAALDPLGGNIVGFTLLALLIHLGLNWVVGNYNILNRYMGLPEAIRLAQTGVAASCLLTIAVVAWPLVTGAHVYLVPRSVVFGGGFVVIVAMVAARFSQRVIYELTHKNDSSAGRVLLIGAGQAADMLIREIQRSPWMNLNVIGMLDDNPDLKGVSLHGPRVLGTVDEVARIAAEQEAKQIIIAIPSASPQDLARIHRLCKPTGLPLRTLPNLADLVSGRVSMTDTRELKFDDLLGRPPVKTDLAAISERTRQQTVLVTGAGGSIGSELCRQIAGFQPRTLVLVDHDESALYHLHERLHGLGFHRYVIRPSSILQASKMESLFATFRPDLVFHAAAYKHVPLMELTPDQAVLNNIQGTMQISELAGRHGCGRFVYISTDKAVEPVNVMGATKRAGELIVRMMARRFPQTLFSTVRFGNVLGSQGSVIPIFKGQIESGGPVTVTHPGVNRYFMTIEEAVQLVLQAAFLCGCEPSPDTPNLNTFVLEMGEPVPIVDLAQRMLEFYWQDGDRSIGVEFSGLRPGERLDEMLVWPQEQVGETGHPLIKRVNIREDESLAAEVAQFEQGLSFLMRMAANRADPGAVVRALSGCVRGFIPLNGAAKAA